MAESFGIPQLEEYLAQMGLRLSNVDRQKEIIELAFHGNHGQWRMVVGIQQSGDVRKLMLIAPHIGTVAKRKRLECLEALMAVNYRIAMGKFGLDLDDGEIRLEEAVPLAQNSISFEQFQLVFGAIMQTVAMYHSLIPRIIYGNMSIREALAACEQDFFKEMEDTEEEVAEEEAPSETVMELVDTPELDVNDVLAEIARMLEDHKE
jgi:hypothetical protein